MAEDERVEHDPNEINPNPADVERMFKLYKSGDEEEFQKAFERLQRKLSIDQEVREEMRDGRSG